ncbi:MAG: LptF/LptG family permease [Oligoflexales bacterium]|nr:LptF/LptG family permease [Oligoflexales bacterium]
MCVLTAVIVISQLVRLTEVLVTFGLTLENILLPFLFIVMPFLAFTIPIAYLFAVFISFSRLSADGEFIAMLASGYSLKKSSVPVLIIGFFLFLLGSYCSLTFEPWGRRETLEFFHRKTQTELDNMIKVKMKSGVFLDNFLGYVLYAEEISSDKTKFSNVLLAPGENRMDQSFTLMAPNAFITGTVEAGDLRMSFDHGMIYSAEPMRPDISIVKFNRLDLDLLRIFQEQIFGPDMAADDYRSYPPEKLVSYVDDLKKDVKAKDTYLKARFLLHQRFGWPFAAISYSLIAMVLGIQDERKGGKSKGYLGTLLTLMLGYIMIMGFKWISEKGALSAPLGVWVPNIILLVFGLMLVYQRNRLPPSESTLNPRYFPGFGRFYRKN